MTPQDLANLHAFAMTDPRPWSVAEFADLLKQGTVHISADSASLAVGRTAAGEAELLTLATLPTARRRGYARARLMEFEIEARRRGAEVAFLDVADDNAAAIALYLAAGYIEVGRRPDYYVRPSGGAAALVMRKPLLAE